MVHIKHGRSQKTPELKNPRNITETFSNEICSIELGAETAIITFGIRRVLDTGTGKAKLCELSQVACVALPISTLNDLMVRLRSLSKEQKLRHMMSVQTSEKSN
jgi:hypothetical protein